jgi:hypothetical protein
LNCLRIGSDIRNFVILRSPFRFHDSNFFLASIRLAAKRRLCATCKKSELVVVNEWEQKIAAVMVFGGVLIGFAVSAFGCCYSVMFLS